MDMTRFTDEARILFLLAKQEAYALHHEYLGTDHLLLAMLRKPGSCARTYLVSKKVLPEEVILRLIYGIRKGKEDSVMLGPLPHTPSLKRVVERAIAESRGWRHDWLGEQHLLIGLAEHSSGVQIDHTDQAMPAVMVNYFSDLAGLRKYLFGAEVPTEPIKMLRGKEVKLPPAGMGLARVSTGTIPSGGDEVKSVPGGPAIPLTQDAPKVPKAKKEINWSVTFCEGPLSAREAPLADSPECVVDAQSLPASALENYQALRKAVLENEQKARQLQEKVDRVVKLAQKIDWDALAELTDILKGEGRQA